MSELTPVVVGNARFTVLAEGCVRLEYAEKAAFCPYPSVLVGKGRNVRPLPAEVERTPDGITLSTPLLTLRYRNDGQPFSPANLQVEHKNYWNDKTTWVPGKRDSGNLGTVTRCLDFWKHCGGPAHYPVEGILSTDGAHYLPDEPRVYWNTKYDWPENWQNRVRSDGYLFAYGNDLPRALRDFVAVFGPVPMVPRWVFGFWYSRWHAYTDKEFVELAKEYRRNEIPIDVMIIDTDWRDTWGGYDWSKKYFPNPRRALKQLHDIGLKTSLNDHPGYDNYDALPDHDTAIPRIERLLGPLPHQGQWACDWSNKRAVAVWRKELLGKFFDDGMDFWWVDGWIKSPFAVTPVGGTYVNGTDSQLWANHHYFDLCEEKTGKRGLILSRWGGIGSHRYPVQFSGDTPSEWSVLQHQVEFTARSGNLGACYWSHDIGGFFDDRVDEELYIRWFQFGSLSPVFRTHSSHGTREPWKYSETLQRCFRKQTRMRYALAPYLYTLARDAHETGLPLCRPLYLEYRDNDGGALNQRREYSLGRDLLVIPIDSAGSKETGLARKRAYFPNGRWVSLETNEVVHGISDRALDIPLDRIPVYVRSGAILPCQPVGKNLGTATPAELHVDFYPDRNRPSEFTLYEDDGASHDHAKGRFARTALTGSRTEDTVTFTIAKPKGTYKGQPKRRTSVLRVILEPGETIASAEVRVGRGKPKSIAALRTRTILAGELPAPHNTWLVRCVAGPENVTVHLDLG